MPLRWPRLIVLAICVQVNPVGFMTYPEFKKSFIEPIQAGQERDATQYVKIKMAKKLSVLQDATAVGSGRLCRRGVSGCAGLQFSASCQPLILRWWVCMRTALYSAL